MNTVPPSRATPDPPLANFADSLEEAGRPVLDVRVGMNGWSKDVETLAFDVRQYHVVRWTEPDGLRRELETRIRALGYALKDAEM